jgi:hypothetical protein
MNGNGCPAFEDTTTIFRDDFSFAVPESIVAILSYAINDSIAETCIAALFRRFCVHYGPTPHQTFRCIVKRFRSMGKP